MRPAWPALALSAALGWTAGAARSGGSVPPPAEAFSAAPAAPPLRPGYRAFSFSPENVEVARQVRPRDGVDVILAFEQAPAGSRGHRRSAAVRLLENSRVLDSDGRGRLTLALNSNEVQYMELALQQGAVSVGLRGYGDVESHPGELAKWADVIRD